MTAAEEALTLGRSEGAIAAIATLATIDDVDEAAEGYQGVMRVAYWEDKNLGLATAIAYAGVSRLLAAAAAADSETAMRARSAVKGLTYDLASFTWPGWDEPGITVGPSEAAAGLAAAKANLAMAHELEKGDLAVSRALWMLGAHELTSDQARAAAGSFEAAALSARLADAEPEARLAEAFAALAAVVTEEPGAVDALEAGLARLAEVEGGEGFVAQVRTARLVLDS